MDEVHDLSPTPWPPARSSYVRWLLRTLGRNPLVRGTDRVEAATVALAAVLTLVAVPVSASAGSSVYHDELQVVRAEAGDRRPATGTATTDSTAVVGYPALARVPVEWAAGTQTRNAVITIGHVVKADEPVQLWLTGAGDITVPPRSDDDARLDGIMVGAQLWALMTVPGVALVMIVRAALNRCRSRDWDREHRGLAG